MMRTIKALGVLALGATAVVVGSGSASALGANVDGEGVIGPLSGTLQRSAPDQGSVRESVEELPVGQAQPAGQGAQGGGGKGLLGGVPASPVLVPDVALANVSAPGLLR
ncbi:hypothetical protein ACZ90_25865 [Streptomyces albus subsp. albus]|nr:hypothetical protein ACZ90_25865 [Streptomyces albus subsp. albus]